MAAKIGKKAYLCIPVGIYLEGNQMKKDAAGLILAIIMAFCGHSALHAQGTDSSYRIGLKKFMEASGAVESMETMIPCVVSSLAEMFPAIDKKGRCMIRK